MSGYQELRMSQMVLQYGPGSILETTEGPRLIPLPEHGLFGEEIDPEDFVIDVPQLKKILDDKRVFRLPVASDLQDSPHKTVWRTRPFPDWKLCVDHGILYRRVCPKCGHEKKKAGVREAIRFVVACPKGHLDDVDWYSTVHEGRKCGGTEQGKDPYFDWITRGGSFGETVIRCPVCNASKTLAEIYRRPHRCSGRYPEREPLERGSQPHRPGCEENAFVIQRQSTALRIPDTLTVLTVPPYETEIRRTLSRQNVLSSLKSFLTGAGLWDIEAGKPTGDKEEIYSGIEKWLEMMKNDKEERKKLKAGEWERLKALFRADRESGSELFLREIENTRENPAHDSMETLLQHEFLSLLKGSRTGIPSGQEYERAGTLLEIRREEVVSVDGPGGKMKFLVAPVRKLHTVTVQTGYRRAVGPFDPDTDPGLPGNPVPVHSEWNGELWLPGYEATGEGIFITSAAPDAWHFPLQGRSAKRWLERWVKGGKYGGAPNGLEKSVPPHPLFYWWHTLSHLLLHAISVESGYSLASIRERIYVEADGPDRARGGVLLYTTGRGVSGSMGGLIALVPVFTHFLQTALENAFHCSADPLCAETVTEHSGAACFACALVPETSCENRNMWLDRNIIIENVP